MCLSLLHHLTSFAHFMCVGWVYEFVTYITFFNLSHSFISHLSVSFIAFYVVCVLQVLHTYDIVCRLRMSFLWHLGNLCFVVLCLKVLAILYWRLWLRNHWAKAKNNAVNVFSTFICVWINIAGVFLTINSNFFLFCLHCSSSSVCKDSPFLCGGPFGRVTHT